ncbi:hypothetical protein NDU88_001823 [Pleurodeles waltl]|uniref:Uncharacterized protein n=1 Tax=Pleurodeles waltl TaxID=8319 RepID=A0AAV7VXI7_PLEWA|nr:hypothetical protein NDU88_001823 [Pleurodeles waltl]
MQRNTIGGVEKARAWRYTCLTGVSLYQCQRPACWCSSTTKRGCDLKSNSTRPQENCGGGGRRIAEPAS